MPNSKPKPHPCDAAAVGVYPGVPFRDYLSWPAASSHDLGHVLRSPAHYFHNKNAGGIKVTAAMEFGSAAHAWVLDPATAPQHVAVLPEEINRRTKIGKEQYATFTESNSDKVIVSAPDSRRLASLAASVAHTPGAVAALERASHVEDSLLWADEATGMLCRGRPDAWGADLVVDLKTCLDARPEAFAKNCAAYGYHMQGYAYTHALHVLGKVPVDCAFVIIAVESYPPHGCAVYYMSPDDLARGGEMYHEALGTLAAAQDKEQWHGYATEQGSLIQELELPSWHRKQHDDKYRS